MDTYHYTIYPKKKPGQGFGFDPPVVTDATIEVADDTPMWEVGPAIDTANPDLETGRVYMVDIWDGVDPETSNHYGHAFSR